MIFAFWKKGIGWQRDESFIRWKICLENWRRPIPSFKSLRFKIQRSCYPFNKLLWGRWNSPQLLGRYWKQLVWYCKRLMCFSAGRVSDFSCIVDQHRGRNINMSRELSAVGRDCSKKACFCKALNLIKLVCDVPVGKKPRFGSLIWKFHLYLNNFFKIYLRSQFEWKLFRHWILCLWLATGIYFHTCNRKCACDIDLPQLPNSPLYIRFWSSYLPSWTTKKLTMRFTKLDVSKSADAITSFFVSIYWFNLKVSPAFVPLRT